MIIQKNIASQRAGFVMVDATDFATPEPGLSPVGHISKDGGSFVSATNTVSEADSGLYVLTFQDSETDCDLLALKATSAGAADQYLIFYPQVVQSIVSDVLAMATGNSDILSQILLDTAAILVDTSDLSNIKTIVSDVESNVSNISNIVSQIHSTIDDNVASELTAVKSDVAAVYSALSDFEKAAISDITAVYSALSDFEVAHSDALSVVLSSFDSYVYGPVGSIMVGWSQLVSDVSNCESMLASSNIGLDALETIVSNTLAMSTGNSDILSQILLDTAAILTDTSDLSNIKTIVSDVESNVSNVSGVVSDILSAIANTTYGLDALETITSDILELGGGSADWTVSERKQIRSALGVTGAVSALAAYGANSRLDNATYGLDALETITSDILALGGGSADWGAKERAQIRSALGVSGAVSALEAYGIKSTVSNILSTLDDNVAGELTSVKSDVAAVYSSLSDLEKAIVSDVTQVYSALSDFEATIVSDVVAVYSALSDFEATAAGDVTEIKSDITAVKSALSDCEATLISDVAAVKSSVSDTLAMATGNSDILSQILVDTATTLDNKVDSILEDTKTTLDNKLDSILVDTGTTLLSQLSSVESAVAGTFAEPAAGAPPAAPTLNQMVNYVYRAWRNKTPTTSAVTKLRNDDDSSTICSAAVSDDGTTFTKAKMV